MTDPLLRLEIEALIAEFAWRIDRGDPAAVADLFTPDGWYGRSAGERSVGRDAIRAAYAARAERQAEAGVRTARHLFTNLRLERLDADSAAGSCILLLFAADGPPPHPAVPLLVQDYDDTYRRTGGRWLFASRSVAKVFVGENFAPVLPLGATA
ncbi:MAG: nuclear transport factor 2 family protein [Rhodospirillaceae bacterium]|nr:nuclear transport factor 2 family protein [Rhodospirillaceae bacterium]MYB14126.1 nuclear transport factor 2 family protein [Rhodospirillaceae bacterium]MYI49595.1 nuclear transport factor 2 family protein [Rhodospirillaceae bacterium]